MQLTPALRKISTVIVNSISSEPADKTAKTFFDIFTKFFDINNNVEDVESFCFRIYFFVMYSLQR